MYSLVLMAALTTPADAPTWGLRSGCGGCTGFGVRSGCSGCHGAPNFAAHGGGGCWSVYGPITYYGFAGCYGSCYGSYSNYFSYWSTPPNIHYGYGMPMKVGPPPPPKVPPAVPAKPDVDPTKPKPMDEKKDEKKDGKKDEKKDGKKDEKKDEKKEPETAEKTAAAATVTVTLPELATLYANGQKTAQTTAERRFVTPILEPGKVFHYVFTAETLRDGKMVGESRIVEVVAGGSTRVDFGDMATARPKADSSHVVIGGRIGD